MTTLRIKVKPGSKTQGIEKSEDAGLVIRLKSPPIDGKANEELIQVLSKHYGVPKARIQIKTGASSRQKVVEIRDIE